ncbi:hypothetical protein OPKNFCMD_1130 [Methylobacterium crusticola]|uniref:Uncharacterized protein n=1 Tax=Methylobacterium crusticola TaxID=1697972 RepID=A0ABQ4QUZ9_9HYPH|nr:hypothetical protein OPKNFCMD_1130 [Methylobacterium crusticola]
MWIIWRGESPWYSMGLRGDRASGSACRRMGLCGDPHGILRGFRPAAHRIRRRRASDSAPARPRPLGIRAFRIRSRVSNSACPSRLRSAPVSRSARGCPPARRPAAHRTVHRTVHGPAHRESTARPTGPCTARPTEHPRRPHKAVHGAAGPGPAVKPRRAAHDAAGPAHRAAGKAEEPRGEPLAGRGGPVPGRRACAPGSGAPVPGGAVRANPGPRGSKPPRALGPGAGAPGSRIVGEDRGRGSWAKDHGDESRESWDNRDPGPESRERNRA